MCTCSLLSARSVQLLKHKTFQQLKHDFYNIWILASLTSAIQYRAVSFETCRSNCYRLSNQQTTTYAGEGSSVRAHIINELYKYSLWGRRPLELVVLLRKQNYVATFCNSRCRAFVNSFLYTSVDINEALWNNICNLRLSQLAAKGQSPAAEA